MNAFAAIKIMIMVVIDLIFVILQKEKPMPKELVLRLNTQKFFEKKKGENKRKKNKAKKNKG